MNRNKIPSLSKILTFSKKRKISAGIELDSNYARVSVLEKNGKDLVFSAMPFEIELIGDNEQDGIILMQELKRRGLDIKTANFSIPTSTVLIRNLSIPKVSEKELIDAIQWNIKEDIESLKTETVYDYSVIYEDKGFYDIIVVIAKREQIDRVLKVAENAKIEADIIEPSATALLNLALLQKEKTNNLKEEKKYLFNSSW